MNNEITEKAKKELLKVSERTKFFSSVYLWMFIGLLITGLVGFAVSRTPAVYNVFNGNFAALIIALFVMIGLPLIFQSRLLKMSATGAFILFFVYTALMGAVFSSIFIYFKQSSLVSIFFVTSLTFFGVSIYGFTTKKDLRSWGSIITGLFFGGLALAIVNIFFHSSTIMIIFSLIGLLMGIMGVIFTTKNLTTLYSSVENMGTATSALLFKFSLLGALALYASFIQIFINLLYLFGQRN